MLSLINKNKVRVDTLIRKDLLICLESDVVHYDFGFTITQKWFQSKYS